MSNKINISTKKHGKIILDDTHYLAGGGEGNVYVKSGEAFKIYHDSSKMLPIAKIHELSVLKGISCIVIPEEIIYDSNGQAIGYTMKYIDQGEYFCKYFTKGFKDAHNITPVDIMQMVSFMQKTLHEIHAQKVIVGDYNEMNFIFDKGIKIPYHIDVDSWQTPSFKGTAIMETVQDLTVPMGFFNENTDWYSWAVITFQMFIGVHPYKGKHPNYKPKDFKLRVKNNISVFNPDVDIPAMCADFSTIPRILRDWYQEVFEKGLRGVPPDLNNVSSYVPNIGKIIKSGADFEVFDYYNANELIGKIFNFKENLFIIVADGFIDFQTKLKKSVNNIVGLCEVLNEDPVIATKGSSEITFTDSLGNEIGKVAYDRGFFANGAFYSIYAGSMVENTFVRMRNVMHISKVCDKINNYAYKVFNGMVIQDMVGKINLTIPYAIGKSTTVRVVELDGQVILDAKYEGFTAILYTQKNGVYNRFILSFNKDFIGYKIRKDEDIDLNDVNFTVLPNGVVANFNGDEKMELFASIASQTKEVLKPPCTSNHPAYNHLGKVIYVDGKILKKMSLKK